MPATNASTFALKQWFNTLFTNNTSRWRIYRILSSMLMDARRMRIFSFAALTAILALAHQACAQGFDDAHFCHAMQEIAKERGSKPDGHTTHLAVTVLCDAKIVD
jgi:hypothetical protein